MSGTVRPSSRVQHFSKIMRLAIEYGCATENQKISWMASSFNDSGGLEEAMLGAPSWQQLFDCRVGCFAVGYRRFILVVTHVV